MSHNEVFNIYKEIFPTEVKDIDTWFTNGKNSIRIRFITSCEVIFTCESRNEWDLRPI